MATAVKERPILFSGEMVRAILDGRKTQTRRVVKPQPMVDLEMTGWQDDYVCPYGAPGERLWVRETWQHESPHCDDHACGNPDHAWFKATEVAPDTFPSWRPSIHMPRWASRLLLEVTEVRVERLRDCTEVDCQAEGCLGGHDAIRGYAFSATPREHFRHVWNSINGKKHPWESNPWVWVVGFKRMQDAET